LSVYYFSLIFLEKLQLLIYFKQEREGLKLMSDGKQLEFTGWRAVLWPIHGWEMKKFLPMSLMMFFILFIYSMTKDLKDALVVSIANYGDASNAPAIKIMGVMIGSVLIFMLFSRLSNKYSMQRVFYIFVTGFIVFFALFGFILFPLSKNIIHPSAEWTESMMKIPVFGAFMPAIGNWSYSLFYIVAEMWGGIAIGSLFWQFANQVVKKTEAKRFYGLFSFVGNIGLIFCGILVTFLSEWTEKIVGTEHKGGEKVNVLSQKQFESLIPNVMVQMSVLIVFGIALMLVYRYINKKVLTDKRFYDLNEEIKKRKEKPKVSMKQSVKTIFGSSYLMLMFILQIGYGISVHLTEILINDRLNAMDKLNGGGGTGFSKQKAQLTIITGVVTMFITLFGSNVLRKCSWRTTALITPVFTLILGGIFFSLIFYGNAYGWTAGLLGTSTLYIAAQVGKFQDGISRGIKYALYDSSKQMAFRPLDHELKTKGQVAVEVIGGRFGKCAGAVVPVLLRGLKFATLNMAPIFAIIVFPVVLGWIAAVFSLSKKYEKLIAEQRETG